jgi:hypothetical protein
MLVKVPDNCDSRINNEQVNDKYSQFARCRSRRLQTDRRNINISNKITKKRQPLALFAVNPAIICIKLIDI